MPPGPPTSRPPETLIQHHTDYDTLSEKYWGEILERTVSSSSLQTLQQRTYHTPSDQQQNPSIAGNGQQVIERKERKKIEIFVCFFVFGFFFVRILFGFHLKLPSNMCLLFPLKCYSLRHFCRVLIVPILSNFLIFVAAFYDPMAHFDCWLPYGHNTQHQLHCLKSSVIDLNYRQHHPIHLQQEQSSTPQPTSNQMPSAKQLLFNQSYPMRCTNNIEPNTNLANFSNSEPHLCDLFIHHDVNCAKNRTAFLTDRHHSIKGLPNI